MMVDFAKLLRERRGTVPTAEEDRADQDQARFEDAALFGFNAGPIVAVPEEEEILPVAEPQVEIPAALLSPHSFLCGAAGVGKTYLARAMAKQLKGTVLAATTGIASVNLGEGTTINALLGYFDTASLVESYTSGLLTARLGKLWKSGLRRILLDEVSMLDAEQLTVITRALEELAGRGYVLDAQMQDEIEETGETDSDPIALTLIGDFCQLPPVKAPFAFESPEWGKYAEHQHTLTKIHRQADADFIQALQAARRGDAATVIDFFRPRLVQVSDNAFEGVTIMATNDAVSRYNALRMDKIASPVCQFATERWGTQRGDWKQIPDLLSLKVGALVMILANERITIDGDVMNSRLIYANGDLGTVVAMDNTKVLVQLQRNKKTEEIQWVTRQNTIPMEPGRRKALRAKGEEHLIVKEGRFELVGEVTYLPLRIAYATTCHKSQGLSLDRVQVNTREGFFKSPGLLYVSLSRARTADGLRLVGTVDGLRERCTVHAKVKGYL